MKNLLLLIILLTIPTLNFGQEKLEFCYNINNDENNSSLLQVQARIINSSDSDIFFLSESCNGLDYFLKTSSTDVEVFAAFDCNITYPKIEVVKANSEYTFKTMLRLKNNTNNPSLCLTFVELNSTTDLKGKNVNNIKENYIKKTTTIKGQLLNLEKS